MSSAGARPARARMSGSTYVARPSSIQAWRRMEGNARWTISWTSSQLDARSAGVEALPTEISMVASSPAPSVRPLVMRPDPPPWIVSTTRRTGKVP